MNVFVVLGIYLAIVIYVKTTPREGRPDPLVEAVEAVEAVESGDWLRCSSEEVKAGDGIRCSCDTGCIFTFRGKVMPAEIMNQSDYYSAAHSLWLEEFWFDECFDPDWETAYPRMLNSVVHLAHRTHSSGWAAMRDKLTEMKCREPSAMEYIHMYVSTHSLLMYGDSEYPKVPDLVKFVERVLEHKK